MKSALSLKIIELDNIITKNKAHGEYEGRYKIKKLLTSLLKQDPNNIELWLRLALVYELMPYADFTKSYLCLKKALKLDKNNVQAWLMYAEFSYWEKPIYDEALCNQLLTMNTGIDEVDSMISYKLSWCFHLKENKEKEFFYLKKSVDLYQGHVHNYEYLAINLEKQGKKAEALMLMQKAVSNVKKIYNFDQEKNQPIEEQTDFLDPEEYINQHIKGIHLSKINYMNLQEEVERLSLEVNHK